MNGVTTVSLMGVGGQGILLAAAIIAETASAAGLRVKTSEVHGMAQRGGSVLSTVRFGKEVWSPVTHSADVVIATELLEGHRGLGHLGPRGALVCAVSTRIAPGSVLRGEQPYPDDLPAAAAARGVRLVAIDAEALAREAGTLRAVNVALLGAASAVLPFTAESWQRGLAAAVPARILEVNLRAFALGRDAVGAEDAQAL
ncbi:MAG: indolepyruvate oxidoreductase subunit beta [Actinomycetes bacterium]